MWLLLACAFREPAQTPPLAAAQAPVRLVEGPTRPGALEIVVRAGSAYDPPSREGLAWVAAHAAAPSAHVEVGPEIVRIELDANAGLQGALNLTPDAAAVAAARDAALSELRGGECEAVALRAWDRWALAGHPYGHAVEGRTSVLPTITPGEVHAFLRARYTRDAVRIAVSAPMDTSGLNALLPTLSRPVTPAVPPPPTNGARLYVTALVGSSCVVIGRPDDRARNAGEVAVLSAFADAIGADVDATVRVDPGVRWSLALGEGASASSVESVWNRVTSQRTVHRASTSAGLMRVSPTAARLAAESLLPALVPLSPVSLPDDTDVTSILSRVADPSRLRMVVVSADVTPFRPVESQAPFVVQPIEDLLR